MMTQSPSTPESRPPERTPEQHAAVRRRSLSVAIAANVLGVAALVMLLSGTVGVHQPPDLFAANMSFCAVLMGVGILFYVKATPGTGATRALCLTATLLGLVGPAIFARQSVQWHGIMESTEQEHAAAVARAAEKFAHAHNDAYPPDLAALLAGNYLTQETLLSPFGGQGTEYLNAVRQKTAPKTTMATASDYTYVGSDLHLPLPPAAASAIVVVYETDPVMREHFAVGFADGSSGFLTFDEAAPVLRACNTARATLGLPPLKKPDSIARATAQIEPQGDRASQTRP